MFWIALELSMPKTGLNIMLSLTVKKLDAFKFDGAVESDNTERTETNLTYFKWGSVFMVTSKNVILSPLNAHNLQNRDSSLYQSSWAAQRSLAHTLLP